MGTLWLWMWALLGMGIASANEQETEETEEKDAIPLLIKISDKVEYGVTISDYTIEGVASDDCMVFVALISGKHKGVYETKARASEQCEATATVVNSWFFSPSKEWRDRSKAPPLNFMVKIRPGAESQQIAVPNTLVPKDAVLPSIAEAIAIEPVEPKRRVSPVYPAKAQRKGIEGSCQVRIFIDETGKPYDARIEQCPEIFHESVTNAALKWRFKPMTDEGVASHAEYLLFLKFKIN